MRDILYKTYVQESGWYRILESSNIGSASFLSYCICIDIRISYIVTSLYPSYYSEFHKVSFVTNPQPFYKSTLDCSNQLHVLKIRAYLLQESNSKKVCIDLLVEHVPPSYDSNEGSPLQCTLDYLRGMYGIYNQLNQPVLVEENQNVIGTVYEHTFKANSWLDGPDTWPLQ